MQANEQTMETCAMVVYCKQWTDNQTCPKANYSKQWTDNQTLTGDEEFKRQQSSVERKQRKAVPKRIQASGVSFLSSSTHPRSRGGIISFQLYSP